MTGPARLELGPIAAGVGSVVLVVSLFLDWFEPGIVGWEIFEVLDLLLAACALAALVAAAARMGLGLPARLRRPEWLLPAAALATAITVSQVIDHPPAGVDRDTDSGIWLALLGSGLMLLGAVLASARISVAVNVDRREPPAAGPAAAQAAPGTAERKPAAEPVPAASQDAEPKFTELSDSPTEPLPPREE